MNSDINNETIQINLNSQFATRYINDSRSNVYFDLPNISIGSQHHAHLSIINMQIPYSFYNINEYNNDLVISINNVLFLYKIQPGNYNVNNFVSYLNLLIVNSGCTISYDGIRNKLKIINMSNNFLISPLSSSLRILGFESNIQSIDGQIIAINCLNLQSVQCLHILSNYNSGNINSSNFYNKNTLCTIPINSSPYSNILYENNNNISCNLYNSMLTEINITIVDQSGEIVNLNGLDWSLTLKLEIVDFVN